MEEGNNNLALKGQFQFIATLEAADKLGSSPVIERGRKAVELLFELKQFIPRFVQSHNIPKNQGRGPFSFRTSVLTISR